MTEPEGPIFRLRRGALAWRQVHDETIVLDLSTSEYLGANEPGSVLWSGLVHGATHDQLVTRLRAVYDVDEELAVVDVIAFLADCRARGFLDDDPDAD